MGMFQFDPNSSDPFIKNGHSNGGCWSSDAPSGFARSKEELLKHAASNPYPNENLVRRSVRDRLVELHDRYHNPNWHEHYCVT